MTQRPKNDRIVTDTPSPERERAFYLGKLALPAATCCIELAWSPATLTRSGGLVREISRSMPVRE